MKKTTAIILTLVLLLLPVLGLTGCKDDSPEVQPKTPVEMFALGGNKLADFFSMGSLPTDELKDANKGTVGIKNLSISSPEAEMDISIPDITLSATTADNKTVVDLGIAIEEEKLDAKIDVTNDGSFLLAIPALTEYYLSGSINDIAELAGESADEITEAINKGTESTDAIKKLFEEKLQKFNSADYIKSEKVDVTVYGQQKIGVEKVTLTVPNEDIVEIVNEINKLFESDEVVGEDDEKITLTVVYYFEGETLIRAELNLLGEKDAIKVYGDMKNEDGANKADIKVEISSEDSTVAVPITYSCKTLDGKTEGEFTVKADADALSSFGSEEDSTVGEDGEAVEIPTEDLGEIELTAKWNGTVSDTASDVKITFDVKVQNTIVSIPMNLKTEKTETAYKMALGIDTSIMGTSIKADIELVFEKGATATGVTPNAEKEIALKSLAAGDAAAMEKVGAITVDLANFMAENPGFAELISMLEPLFGGTDPDVDDNLAFIAYNDSMSFSFFVDGAGYQDIYYEAEVASDGKSINLLQMGQPVAVITLAEDGTAVESGVNYTYTYDEDGNVYTLLSEDESSEIFVYGDDGYCSVVFYYSYEMDEANIVMNFNDGESYTYGYTVDEAAEIITIEGVEFVLVTPDM